MITAGSGIFHSEYNLEDEPTHMFQIWIKPREKGLQIEHESGLDLQTNTQSEFLLIELGV